jgi:PIN domain nuclease of toxin-antitoxin system
MELRKVKELLLLDTHTLLWSLLEPKELSKEARRRIDLAQENNLLMICSISLWEIAMLSHKKRINIYEPLKDFLKSIVNIGGVMVKDISPEVASESVVLVDYFHGDPADRIIAATTKIHGATIITRDQKILDWAKHGHVKFVKA